MTRKDPAPDGSDGHAEGQQQQAQKADRKPLPGGLPDREGGERDEKEQRDACAPPLTLRYESPRVLQH